MTQLTALIDKQIKTSFRPEFQDSISEAEGLGLVISQYFRWDGVQILKTAIEALEDANFHTLANKLEEELRALEAK